MRQALLPFFEWYAGTALSQVMTRSATLIEIAQIVHLIGMTLLIGTIMMVDFTLLGCGIKRQPAARVGGELAPYTLAGLALMLFTGPLNLASEAMRCYDSSFFWIKMGLLAVTLIFHFTVHRRVVAAEPPASRFQAGLTGSVSLALWFGIALAAKFIAFFGEDLRQQAEIFTNH